MSEMKPTLGPWTQGISRYGMECVWLDGETEPVRGMGADHSWIDCGTADNARLIAEAGTVFHNTGLSPVQLVEMVKELKAALCLMVRTHDEPAENLLQEVKEQQWLDKARAALAKCEGVGND